MFEHFPMLNSVIKKGYGAPKVIFWAVLIFKCPMPHIKFHGYRSEEEDYKRFLLPIGMTAMMVMWPGVFDGYVALAPWGSS